MRRSISFDAQSNVSPLFSIFHHGERSQSTRHHLRKSSNQLRPLEKLNCFFFFFLLPIRTTLRLIEHGSHYSLYISLFLCVAKSATRLEGGLPLEAMEEGQSG